MSSKFKVGDRVHFSDHVVSGIGIIVGKPPKWEDERFAWTLRAESFDHAARGFYGNVEDYEFPVRYFAEKDLKPIAPSYQSPVKERVVKEIVPGVYGRVSINNYPTKELASLSLTGSNLYNVHELRHAARVFNDLAEALEGNKDD